MGRMIGATWISISSSRPSLTNNGLRRDDDDIIRTLLLLFIVISSRSYFNSSQDLLSHPPPTFNLFITYTTAYNNFTRAPTGFSVRFVSSPLLSYSKSAHLFSHPQPLTPRPYSSFSPKQWSLLSTWAISSRRQHRTTSISTKSRG